jgi:hypothetical protein
MAGPRVFLSHSTKDDPPRQVRDRLAEALRDAEFRVLLDKDGLKTGEGWHNTLELWLGTCDAAVVLLSEAALASNFVAHEVSVLTYRKRHDPKFVLLPVFIRPVDYVAVAKSLLTPSRITDLETFQTALAVGDDPADEKVIGVEAAVAAIVQRLAEAVECPSPLAEKIEQLADLLEKVPAHILLAEAKRLGVYFDEAWIPEAAGEERRLAKRLGCALLGAPLAQAQATLYAVRSDLRVRGRQSVQDAVLEALDLIASSWVSAQSALQIRAGLAQGGRAFALDCALPLTPETYVNRACPHRLIRTDRWPTGGVTGVVGEAAKAEIEEAVRQELKRILRGVKTDAALAAALALVRAQPFLQVFVSLPARSVDLDVLQHLRDKFSGVTFFLMTGAQAPAADVCETGRIEALLPPFRVARADPDFPHLDETAFDASYRDARAIVTFQLEET